MPGYPARRRYGAKKPVYKKRTFKKRAPTVRALAKRVSTLAKQIWHYQDLTYSGTATFSTDYFAYNMCDFLAMSATFGTTSNDVHENKCINYFDELDIVVDMANEEQNITCTAYMVKLKDNIGSAFNATTGGLTLTSGAGGQYAFSGGFAFLNRQCFTILKQKRFIVGNNGQTRDIPSAYTSAIRPTWRWRWTASPKSMVGPSYYGDWKVLSNALDPSRQYYILIFNDNLAADSEYPTFSVLHHKVVKTT